MEKKYSVERNVQMLVYLMKEHGVRKVVASPGTTNLCLVASLQYDKYFELYSAADERSAAYIACGLAAESGEPVALSCTGATASRNYIPALTEAYYRHLPVLAITATQHTGRIGQNMPQVIDRSTPLNDIAVYRTDCPAIHCAEDEWAATVHLNEALLALRHNGGGPVHINLATEYSRDFSVAELPPVRVIRRVGYEDRLPAISARRISIFVGAHTVWSERLTRAVDRFCARYGATVYADHTSNYHGKYRVNMQLAATQEEAHYSELAVDLIIDMGSISASYTAARSNEVWRVAPDGVIRDTFRHLTRMFAMSEEYFFEQYAGAASSGAIANASESSATGDKTSAVEPMENAPASALYAEQTALAARLREKARIDLPLSAPYIARAMAPLLPDGSVLHLGILNTIRAWDMFDIPARVDCFANTGGFGIDGCVSALIGAALADSSRLHFGIVGDLAFFYDMNALGNRHVGRNVRLMVVNNGRGTEFRNYMHPAARFGEAADSYMAAAGHYGSKSPDLLRHYATDLGFSYLQVTRREELAAALEAFTDPAERDAPMVLEVFTDSQDESDALYTLSHLEKTALGTAKKAAKAVLGERGTQAVKRLLGK